MSIHLVVQQISNVAADSSNNLYNRSPFQDDRILQKNNLAGTVTTPYVSSSFSLTTGTAASGTTTTTTTNIPCLHQPTVYCKNGGTCNTNITTVITEPCICANGYGGKYCESSTTTTTSSSRRDCTLQCFNNGQCQTTANSNNRMHCECLPGYSGIRCEHTQCGNDLTCLNGAQCLQRGENNFHCDCRSISSGPHGRRPHPPNSPTSMANAVVVPMETTTIHNDPYFYAGLHCQYQSTSICPLPSNNNNNNNNHPSDLQVRFCTNNGVCPTTTTTTGQHHCQCSNGYSGPHCEYSSEDKINPQFETYLSCDLKCLNGGQCRKGIHPNTNNNETATFNNLLETHPLLSHLNMSMSLSPKENDRLEHCLCPQGYVGPHCEYQHVPCGSSTTTTTTTKTDKQQPLGCFHGSQCVVGLTGETLCDCTTASAGASGNHKSVHAVGKHCQYTKDHKDSNNVCLLEEENYIPKHFTTAEEEEVLLEQKYNKVGQLEQIPTAQKEMEEIEAKYGGFCVNGGKCIQTNDGTLACKCMGNYSGLHCEYTTTSDEGETTGLESSKNNNNSNMVSFFAIAGVLVLVFLFLLQRRKAKKQQQPGGIDYNSNSRDSTNRIDTANREEEEEEEEEEIDFTTSPEDTTAAGGTFQTPTVEMIAQTTITSSQTTTAEQPQSQATQMEWSSFATDIMYDSPDVVQNMLLV